MYVLSHPALKNLITFCIYLVINTLFIVKYGESYNIIILIGYLIFISGLSFFYIKVKLGDIFYKSFFWLGIISFFFVSVYVNYKVDGNSLNVDRWSAMEIGIKAILNSQYPYNIPDHMGRESSNLPVLIILGMPFYLVFGSVGYLQSFVFLLFSYLVFTIFKNYKERLAVIILLFISPSYLWEVYVKSDLFSNFIIISAFTYVIWRKFLTKNEIKPEIASFFSALILLTRLSSVIPLIILLFKKYIDLAVKEKIRFAVVFILTICGIVYWFFHNAPSYDVFIKHNPLVIQGAKQPLFLSLSYIVLAFVLSFRIKSFYDIIFRSGILLFICVFLPFLLFFAEYGYTNMITNSFFDLSFFNMSMPFVILSVVYGVFKNNFKED